MPAALLTKEEVLDRVLDAFRDKGYEGASLAELSAATGLKRSSLYHYFPGGKEEMAAQAMAHLGRQLAATLHAPLSAPLPPEEKLSAMLDTLDAFYEGGRKACLYARMSASVDRARFHRPLREAFASWTAAVERLCLEAGIPQADARARAEDLVVRVEGALIVSAGTGDRGVFSRTIDALRQSVLATAASGR